MHRFDAAAWCAVSRRLDFWQQMGGAQHGVPGGKMCSLGDGGSGKLTPRARGGSGAELRLTKVRAGARCSNGCTWSCSHSTARGSCSLPVNGRLEVIPIFASFGRSDARATSTPQAALAAALDSAVRACTCHIAAACLDAQHLSRSVGWRVVWLRFGGECSLGHYRGRETSISMR